MFTLGGLPRGKVAFLFIISPPAGQAPAGRRRPRRRAPHAQISLQLGILTTSPRRLLLTYYLLGALAALRLADMLRPALLECWEAGAPNKWGALRSSDERARAAARPQLHAASAVQGGCHCRHSRTPAT
eukprot:scaffold73864_cov63-Phaeocystis_antarctica.AAC.4